MKTRCFILLLLFSFAACGAWGQQITRFCVCDTAKVYSVYYAQSAAVKAYEEKRAAFQKAINDYTQEIADLNEQRLQAGDEALEAAIKRKTQSLREFTAAKRHELEEMRAALTDDAFYSKLLAVLRSVAEESGAVMVLSVSGDNVLWYSSTIDITDEVIRRLG